MLERLVLRMMEAHDHENLSWRTTEIHRGLWVCQDMTRALRATPDSHPIPATFSRVHFDSLERARDFVRYRCMRAALLSLICPWRRT